VFVSDAAVAAWRTTHGHDLSPNESYAAAKMRLFQAFDEQESLRGDPLAITVDPASIEALLEPLDL
jgi:hypothetical protein